MRFVMKSNLIGGFTIVELMVVSFISTVILGAIFTVMSVGRASFHTQYVSIYIKQQLRQGMENMVRELYESTSDSVNINSDNDEITFQLPVIMAPDTDIYDDNGNIRWGAEGNLDFSIVYLLSGTQLLRRVLDTGGDPVPGSDRVLANNIQTLSFNEGGIIANPQSVTIQIVAQKTTIEGRDIQATLNSQVTFRN